MQLLRGPLTAFLCVSLAFPYAPGWAETAQSASPAHPARPRYQSEKMQGDQRIEHALNRLTFGPRPGDVESVRAIGLERWFAQQLHPSSLDESALNARLAQYPAMRLTSEDLLARFPSNAIIRQANDGKISVPERGIERAVYEDQMYRVAARKQEKEQKPPALANGADANGTQAMAATGNAPPDSYAALTKLQNSLDAPGDPTKGMNMASSKAEDPIANSALVSSVLALPGQQRLARVASMSPADADAFFKSVKGPDRAALNAGLSADQKETMSALENPQRTVVDEVVAERLTRDIYASAQLQEVMTDFWLNHFNVFLHKNEATPYYLASYERDVIRPRALGKFEDLLEATAHSPAMLLYLDNASSIGPDSLAAQRAKLNAMRNPASANKAPEGLNENYARELMELHTLGVNGGYTQADVTQVARILTGWTLDRPQRGGGFRFEPNRHEPGAKKVMGKKFKEDGEREGRDLLHFLATRPATAKFLSRKLAVRFVSDDPPASLVDRMANTYLSSGGDIAAVLKTMFHSPEFWSTDLYRAKVKTPLEFVVSAARASNADVTNMQPLANALRDMGMPVYGAVPPTGYKWDAADWVSTGALVTRMNFALTLAASRLPGIAVQWSTPGSDGANFTARDSQDRNPQNLNPQNEEARLESLLVPGGVSISTRSAVLDQFASQSANPAQPPIAQRQTERARPVQVANTAKPQNRGAALSALERQDQSLAGLLLGSPEFQRR
jgi:uncharacterized protein (DUF1800 family)